MTMRPGARESDGHAVLEYEREVTLVVVAAAVKTHIISNRHQNARLDYHGVAT